MTTSPLVATIDGSLTSASNNAIGVLGPAYTDEYTLDLEFSQTLGTMGSITVTIIDNYTGETVASINNKQASIDDAFPLSSGILASGTDYPITAKYSDHFYKSTL
jgi:hypothetical protein